MHKYKLQALFGSKKFSRDKELHQQHTNKRAAFFKIIELQLTTNSSL